MPRPFTSSPLLATPHPRHRGSVPARRFARTLRIAGWAFAAALAIGCEPAQSSSNDDTMFFGLFKTKSPSTVDPSLGSALVREPAYPRGPAATPPASAYAQVRRVSLTAPPPEGRLSPTPTEDGHAEAFVTRTTPDTPALVNVYRPKRRCELWTFDPKDGTRLATQRPIQFDADQPTWMMYAANEVIALPGDKLLVQLNSRIPNSVNGLYLVDPPTGHVRKYGLVEPDWAAGLPPHYLDSLQVSPDAVLVVYRTDRVRLAAERYVNRYDHLLLFSPRHPDGLEIARLGIDDGNLRAWRLVGNKLWLQTFDTRGDAPREFAWSLDLARVL
jgi:hypothetical protein